MIDNRITTIFFDVGRTLRKNVPNPATRDYWLAKIISTTGISWTPDELARQITLQAWRYIKNGQVNPLKNYVYMIFGGSGCYLKRLTKSLTLMPLN